MMDFSNLWKHCYWFTPAAFHTVWKVRLTVISSHCLAASPAKDSEVISHLRKYAITIVSWSMLLLRNKWQQ